MFLSFFTEFKVPRPVDTRESSSSKTRRKNKPARRALNMDLQEEHLQNDKNIAEAAHTKPGNSEILLLQPGSFTEGSNTSITSVKISRK